MVLPVRWPPFSFPSFFLQYFPLLFVLMSDMEMVLLLELDRVYQKDKKRLLTFIQNRVRTLEYAKDIRPGRFLLYAARRQRH
jgi:hypothetical protein